MNAWLFAHPPRGCCFPECPSYRLCHCGCGLAPKSSLKSQARRYHRAGEPYVFKSGHQPKLHTVPPWGKNGVPIERVRPLLLWLIRRYGTAPATEMLGLPRGTVQVMAYSRRRVMASPQQARLIADLVLAHRHAASSPFDDEDIRRLPTPAERRERAPFEPVRVRDRANTKRYRASATNGRSGKETHVLVPETLLREA